MEPVDVGHAVLRDVQLQLEQLDDRAGRDRLQV
jgi:hypothetical protein